MSENTTGTQVAVGMAVYDVEGERIGTIDQHTVPGQYIAVQKGSLFHKDIYIPFDAIQRSDINGVYLSIHRNDLDAEQYNTPPGGLSSAEAGGATATEATGAGVAGAVAGASASPIGEALSELADDLKGGLGGHHADTAATTNRTSANAGTTDATGTGTESGTNAPSIGEALGGLVAGVKDAVSGGQTGVGAGTTVGDAAKSAVSAVTGAASQAPGPSGPTRADLDAEAIANAFKGQDIDIPVMGEEFAIAKRSVVVEELRLRKVAVHEERQVTDTVRKERISIEGAAQVVGADTTGSATATTGAATTGAANTQTTGTTVQQTTQTAGANAQGAAHGVANAAEGLIDRVDRFLGNDK